MASIRLAGDVAGALAQAMGVDLTTAQALLSVPQGRQPKGAGGKIADVNGIPAKGDPLDRTVAAVMAMRAAIPGNSWILPDQTTQHRRGEADLEWQYPFFRSDLVAAGLLPAEPPPGNPKEIGIPAGMSVFEAIRLGVIR